MPSFVEASEGKPQKSIDKKNGVGHIRDFQPLNIP